MQTKSMATLSSTMLKREAKNGMQREVFGLRTENYTDYDGVFALPPFVWEMLEKKGLNVDYVKD
jgi:hypothetical protein